MNTATDAHNELKRQIEHIFPILFCLLLRDLPYLWIMVLSLLAILYGAFGKNLLVKDTHRPDEIKRGFSLGKIAYALSVFLLLIIFRNHLYIVAGAWAVMALGDGFSNIVGRRFGKRKLPWRKEFSLEGSLAFALVSFPAALGLMLFVSSGRETETLTLSNALLLALVASLSGAIIESVSYKLNDNFTVPLGSAFFIWMASYILGIL
ncbi:MAG: SEC59/DGK1/VTE5 family protein [Myxococcota bacterium]